ncbi:hypothetical protein MHYP_G00247920 [Metynnis hypsauchen]
MGIVGVPPPHIGMPITGLMHHAKSGGLTDGVEEPGEHYTKYYERITGIHILNLQDPSNTERRIFPILLFGRNITLFRVVR